VKPTEQLCPSKVVQAITSVVCDPELLPVPDIVLKALDDTIEYSVAEFGRNKAWPENIENLVLSRIYALAKVEQTKNYSWHVICSEVHELNRQTGRDPSSQHLVSSRALHTNHELLLRESASSGRKEAPGLTTLSNQNYHLRYYSRHVCLFKV